MLLLLVGGKKREEKLGVFLGLKVQIEFFFCEWKADFFFCVCEGRNLKGG